MSMDVTMTDSAAAAAASAASSSSAGAGAAASAIAASGLDEGLYSRQLYVFGREAQQKLQQSNVLFVGMRGLGVETAKNVILAGVKSVGLLDATPTALADLGAQFYLTEADVGKPRADVSHAQLQSLNPYVNVHVVHEPLSLELLASGRYQILVLTESSLSEAIKYNEYCHTHGIKFLWAEVPGVYASLFVDFPAALPEASSADSSSSAQGHFVSDLTGELPARGLIAHVSCATPGIVTVHEDQRHGLQDGDLVTFEEVSGMTQLNASAPRPVKVLTPYTFSIEDTTNYTPYTGTRGYFQQVKQGKFFQFASLKDSLLKDTPISNDNWCNEKLIHLLHIALGRFQDAHGGRKPRVDTWDDAREVAALAKSINETEFSPKVDALSDFLLLNMARVAACELNPLAAFMGGVLGQEVLKGASGKFVPVQQYYYYDGSHVLPSEKEQQATPLQLSEHAPQNSRYDSQIGVFGARLQQRLQEQSYFVVGAGAIGCEMVKNFAMMGVGTAGKGSVTITDMDTIERSNLNRQFLFRNEDVGQMKSMTAAKAVRRMNPALNIHAHSVRVAPQTEDLFNDDFWERLDGVVTALDNVEARIYTDNRCIYYQKPLIDSGTLGTKGSTQVIVPFLTESYGSTRDAPEESIPLCTLKNFPHKIEHTIQWARDAFEGLFKSGPSEANNFLTQPSYLADLARQPNVQITNLQTIKSYLVDDRPEDFAACVRWARMLWEDEYHYKIAQLLYNFPADSATADGQLFWSGTKRAPTVLRFDPADPLHMDFIVSAAILRAVNYRITPVRDMDFIRGVLASVTPRPFVPAQNTKIATTDAEAKAMLDRVEDDHEAKVAELVAALPAPAKLVGYSLQVIEFEKDDDGNSHMDFITACSNLRARNYAIRESDKHETKFTAGKIIPAIATTTALVTGMVCMEIYKLVQPSKKSLEDFRCFSCNLALPVLQSSDPLPPAKSKAKVRGGGGGGGGASAAAASADAAGVEEWEWSLWDRIEVNEGDLTLEQLMDWFRRRYGLEITMLSHGASMLFYNFGVGLKKKVKDRLSQRVSELVQTVGGATIRPQDKYLILEACVQNEDEEEVEIPYVRLRFRQ